MNKTIAVGIDNATLDRLVDGELSERDRADLLGALDHEPAGWKRCAFAFLEAQAWRQGVAGIADEYSTAPAQAKPQGGNTAPCIVFVRKTFAIAAAVMLAFCTGFAFRDARQPQPLMSRHVFPAESTGLPTSAAMSVDQSMADSPAVPEYVRLQLERQGYEVKGDRKVVAIALQDGRKVTVPVESVRYRYVGQKIH